jgi:hypothetical protein
MNSDDWIEEVDDILASVEDTAKGAEGVMITKARGIINDNREQKEEQYHVMTQEDLEDLGFDDDFLETAHHYVRCNYYDGWQLHIEGKPKHSPDDIYMLGYWTKKQFQQLLKVITWYEKTENTSSE